MPNRIIKESLCTSEKIAALSDFEFRLWVGLIVSADDAGRGDARPAIIKGHVFPLRDRVTVKDIDAALHGLAAKGCVSLYMVGGKPYFLFPAWAAHQRIRDSKPRFPAPENGEFCQVAASRGEPPQAAASCGLNPIQSESESKDPNGSNAHTREAPEPDPFADFSPKLREKAVEWVEYKRGRRQGYKPQGLRSLATQLAKAAKQHGEAAVCEIVDQSIANGYQGILWDRLGRGGSGGKRLTQAHNHHQREYTEADFASIGIDLLEEPGGGAE